MNFNENTIHCSIPAAGSSAITGPTGIPPGPSIGVTFGESPRFTFGFGEDRPSDKMKDTSITVRAEPMYKHIYVI